MSILKNKSKLSPWLSYIKAYKLHLVGAVIALLFASISVLILGKAVGFLIDQGISHNNPHFLNNGLFMVMGVILLLALASFFRSFLITYVGEHSIANIKKDLYNHVLKLPCSYFENNQSGELLSRITADTALLQTVLTSSFSSTIRNTIMFIGGLIMMIITSAKLAAIIAFVIVVIVIPIVLFSKKVRGLSKIILGKASYISSHLTETIFNIKTIKAFNYENTQQAKFDHIIADTLKITEQKILSRSLLSSIVISLIFGAVAFVLWIGGHEVIKGHLTSGQLSSFIFYSIVVAGSLGSISDVIGDIQKALGSAERLTELLNEQDSLTIANLNNSNNIHINNQQKATLNYDNSPLLKFEQVSFSYEKNNKIAVNNLNFTINPGEIAAIVGPSGAGKSTLFELILKFYTPTNGAIYIDNINIADINDQELRDYCGIVSQSPVIFSGSAYDNIHIGKITATKDEIIAAAKQAACYDFIMQLPNGFDSNLGEMGGKLSGGEKQRIAIARVFLKNPKILLLDEATSALDSQNEQLVKQALEKLIINRTCLVITHKLDTIKKAKKIIVLEHGKIVETGNHETLLANNGLYANLTRLQFTN